MNGSSNNNILRGSSGRDTISGFDGNDDLPGEGGIDTINGGNGDDFVTLITANSGSNVNGGSGHDRLTIDGGGTFSFGSIVGFEGLFFNLPTQLTLSASQFTSRLAVDSMLNGPGTITVDLNTGNQEMNARGMNAVPGTGVNFLVNGSNSDDVIKLAIYSAGTLFGNAGNDRINGSDLVDTISGGADIDKIRGDGGADILTGGAGADVFKHRETTASGTGANADQITDFLIGTDRLNFARIDTNTVLAGDQGFAFIGDAAFSNNGTAQIRYANSAGDIRVEADVNGDGLADMHIILQGLGGQVMTAADFVL